MKTGTKNNYQFLGFLKTKPIFTAKTNTLQQSIFQIDTFLETKNLKETDFKIPEKLMLGKRVEFFFKHLVSNSKSYNILIENLQIQQNRRTIGEIDFILEHKKTFQKTHIEVAYKFYLFDPNIVGNELSKWIGPNRNDNLNKKITKLQSHQFPLLQTTEAKNTLNNYHISTEKIEQKYYFKAQLFIPIELKKHKFNAVNSEAISGFYIHYKDFIKENHSEKLFFIPKKQDWLAEPKTNYNWHSFEDIHQVLVVFIDKQKTPLIWVKTSSSTFERIFITWW